MIGLKEEFGKIAIIAGSGKLPLEIATYLQANKSNFIISRIRGVTDEALNQYDGHELGLGEFGKRFKKLKEDGVKTVVLVGYLKRPEFSKIGLDAYGLKLLPKMISSGRKGDDALLRLIVGEFEHNGFRVVGADDLRQDMLATKGVMGKIAPTDANMQDILKAIPIARKVGELDIGQGVVVCHGVTLAVEAQEGTDAMLGRIAEIPQHLRGTVDNKAGVLLKCPKPIQEKRIDMPTIGIKTIDIANKVGLAGIALEENGAIILEKDKLINHANELGLFIYGFRDTEFGNK